MNEQTNEQTTAAQAKQATVVEVVNPTAEEMAVMVASVQESYPFKVVVKPFEFKFKKSVDKDTGAETIRKPVVLPVPYPSVDGLVDIIQTGGKGLELLLEAMETIVNSAARELLYDDFKLDAASFNSEKVSWEAIAHLPKAQRKGGGIPKEVWEGFVVDYIAVMPAATGKTLEQVTNMTKILANRLSSVKTNEPVLNVVVEQLTIYLGATTNADDFAECVEFLLTKADQFLNITEEELLAAL